MGRYCWRRYWLWCCSAGRSGCSGLARQLLSMWRSRLKVARIPGLCGRGPSRCLALTDQPARLPGLAAALAGVLPGTGLLALPRRLSLPLLALALRGRVGHRRGAIAGRALHEHGSARGR